jgi:RNA polymerase sigma-70 factor (ECF subfamily)
MRVAQSDNALRPAELGQLGAAVFSQFSWMERMLLGRRAMVVAHPALELGAAPRAHADPARVERLFADHYRFIWRTLRRLGVHDAVADDCAQQVFIIASGRLDEIANQKERSFLIGVAIRVAANARRAHQRRREDADSDAVMEHASAASPEELLDWKQRREKLDVWLGALSLDLRTPFVLFELEGLSLQEVAELLELPLGTVKTRLRKARAIFLEAAGQAGAP